MPPDESSRQSEMNACVDFDQLIVDQPQAQAERQRLAEMVGCFTEEQVALLANVDVSTVRNWRLRKKGPESRPFGRSRLYPVSLLKQFLSSIADAISDESTTEPTPATFAKSRVKAIKEDRRHFVDSI